MSIQINTLEIENVKRIKAVKIECDRQKLTVIGGKNGQGKTSVLDAIAYALGGEKFRPGNLHRDDAMANPSIKIELSNGLVVERSGKNSKLKVTDPNGKIAGQKLLNEFVSAFALDLPRFMNATTGEKAKTLLKIIGVADELAELELQEEQIYSQRHAIGQIADQKAKHAEELPEYPDCPDIPISAGELIQEQQDILVTNGQNRKKRERASELAATKARLEAELEIVNEDLTIAEWAIEKLVDKSAEAIEAKLNEIDGINIRVRANQDKAKAIDDAEYHQGKYDELTEQLESVRRQKGSLLHSADLPLPGLSVVQGELHFCDKKWDSMSGSEQLRVATAIVRRLNPKCGFVLIDKLEQMDSETLATFGEWLEQEGLQAIATRVSTGTECAILIEDGFSTERKEGESTKNFTVGEF